MAKYRARICPNCRFFLGFSVTKMPASDKEVGVISFCLNCSYRLPIHTVMNGFRRATAKFGRRRLKLANSFADDRRSDSGDDMSSLEPGDQQPHHSPGNL